MVTSSPAKRSSVIRDAVVAMAQRLGSDQQMPTSRNLARTLRVSSSTLHPILKQLDQQGILSLRHGKGIFVGNAIGQKAIGVVFGGDIFNVRFSPFWSLLLQAVRQQSVGLNLVPRTYTDLADEKGELVRQDLLMEVMEDVEQRRLHGLLLFAFSAGQIARIGTLGVPTVALGESSDGYKVSLDVASACRMGTRALISSGCRTLAIMGHGVRPLRSVMEEELALSGAVSGALSGASAVADWSYETWAWSIPEAGSLEHCGYQMARRMIAERGSKALPDAVMSMDDTMTRGVIHAMNQAGLQPGRDMRIASVVHRGSPTLELFASDVIAVEFDPAECIREALWMLSELMSGRVPERHSFRVSPRISVR